MKNKYEIRGDVTIIYVNCKGKTLEAIVDTAQLERMKNFQYTWSAYEKRKTGNYYVKASICTKQIRKDIPLHRFLTNAPNDKVVDHRNHNTLDNRLENLRCVSVVENNRNRKGATAGNKSSGVRNVSLDTSSGKWRVRINVDRREILVGVYEKIESAELAAQYAREYYFEGSLEAKEKFDGIERGTVQRLLSKKRSNVQRPSKSGIRGIQWNKTNNRWDVRFAINGERKYFGGYKTIEEAKKVLERVAI